MSEKKTVLALVFFCIIAITFTGVARAEDFRSIEDSSAEDVASGMGNKFVRGVANVATGWMEFPKQIYVTTHEEGTTQGIFLGPLKGIGMTLLRTLAGAGELATFFVPYPGFYDPFIEPAYVWQKE